MRLFFLIFIWLPLVSVSQINIYDYLKLNIKQQTSSRLLLKETYLIDRSKDSPHKGRYMLSREEYDIEGRPSLNIYYDHEGKMTSKIIFFYPRRDIEKGIFKQKGEFMDSVIYTYNTDKQRLSEIWYWGENRSSDTLLYSYNAAGKLSKIFRKYDWDTKWDTLLYKDGLVDKLITYSQRGGMQKEIQLLYLGDSSLLKTNTLNAAKMVIEEEFFFYNRKNQVYKTVVKLYPEGNEIIDPPRRIGQWKYYPNGNLRKVRQVDYSRAGKPVSSSLQRFLPMAGLLAFRAERNNRAGINKKTIINYTIRKNKTVDVR